MASGVARRPIADFAAYRRELERFVFRSGNLMRPMFEAAKGSPRRVAYAEGEDERVLRAVQTVLDDGIAEPVLIGRRAVIEAKVRGHGPADGFRGIRPGAGPGGGQRGLRPADPAVPAAVGRRGVPPDAAARRVGNRPTVAAALLLESGQVDAALAGGTGTWMRQWHYAYDVIGKRPDVSRVYAAFGRHRLRRHAVLRRHPPARRAHRRADRRDDSAGGRAGARPSASCPRWRCCRIRPSVPPMRRPPG